MSGFDDRNIDLVLRLRECAARDEAERAATNDVVLMTREAADEIEVLRASLFGLAAKVGEMISILQSSGRMPTNLNPQSE